MKSEDKQCDTTASCDAKDSKTCCSPKGSCCKKCPGKMIKNILCLICKVAKIAVFVGLALVLFDVHAMFKIHNEMAAMPSAAMMQQASGQAA